jgi:general secretion pathway protein E
MAQTDLNQLSGEEILKRLQQHAAESGMSDIHFSPEKTLVRVETRLHGLLEPFMAINADRYEQLLRVVKFTSKLKLNITNIPQDGQYTFDAPGRTVNVRVATLPSRFGEALTLRLLDPKRGIVSLAELGFPTEMHQALEDIVHMPFGLFLVTGPTGSGKTTTLYALLNTIVGSKRHIVTLEDPIEYEINGIVQSEIDPGHGFTFANGLRSVLRHDPNVILVGEIRDLETAQTAIDASLTGHMVLATLHTNSAIEAIPRLLSMGVSPFTFAPSLRAVLAQRLVRVLKPECRTQGATCDPASSSSYIGRMALPELLVVSQPIRDLILSQAEEGAIEQQAAKEGFKTMKQWGDRIVKEGKTTITEVKRVTT